jgi:hypothetical protein
MRLAFSKERNRVGVSLPSSEDGNSSSFRKAVFSNYLEFDTMDRTQKTTDFESYTPPSELFRFYSYLFQSLLLNYLTLFLLAYTYNS